MSKNISKNNLKFAVLAVDTVLLSIIDGILHVLLIDVSVPQFKGKKGLPGGMITPTETAEEAVARHLSNKAGVSKTFLEQLYTFSSIKRDPRGRVVSVAYMGLVPESKTGAVEGAVWVPVNKIGKLAYDHNEIVLTALGRLRSKVIYTDIVKNLLPKEFTLSQLQEMYEIILGSELDKRNFRKKILKLGLVKATGNEQRGEANRPASLYKWVATKRQFSDLI